MIAHCTAGSTVKKKTANALHNWSDRKKTQSAVIICSIKLPSRSWSMRDNSTCNKQTIVRQFLMVFMPQGTSSLKSIVINSGNVLQLVNCGGFKQHHQTLKCLLKAAELFSCVITHQFACQQLIPPSVWHQPPNMTSSYRHSRPRGATRSTRSQQIAGMPASSRSGPRGFPPTVVIAGVGYAHDTRDPPIFWHAHVTKASTRGSLVNWGAGMPQAKVVRWTRGLGRTRGPGKCKDATWRCPTMQRGRCLLVKGAWQASGQWLGIESATWKFL